jgi:hypothetical protein
MTNIVYLDAGAVIDLEKTGYGHLPTNDVIYKIPDVTYEFEIGKDNKTSAFKAFEQWRTSNSNGVTVEFAITAGRVDFSDPDVARQYGVTWQSNGKPKQIGDAAVKFLQDADGIFSVQNASVITNDRGLMNFATQNSSGRGAYTTTMDFFNELLASNSISIAEYNAVASSLEGRIRSQYPSEYKGIVADSSVLSYLEASNTPNGTVVSYFGIEITPGLLTKAAIGAEALKHAGIAGDVFELSLAINKSNSLLEVGDTVGAEAVYAQLAGSLVGGAAGGSAAVIATGTLLVGSGVGVVPGAIILLSAGVVGSVGGSLAGEQMAGVLHSFAVTKLNNGEPLIIDDLVSFYHVELKDQGIYEEAILTQALVGINASSSDQVQRALLQAVIDNPDLGDDPAALQSALWDVLVNRSGIIGNSNKEDIIEIVQAVAEKSCFGPKASISMWPLDPEFAPDPSNPFKQYDQDAVRAKIWKKPIELIRVGDYVVSHDKNDNMVPGYVPRTMNNQAKVLLNFHGTPVTPGHVYYRPDSKRSYKYETLIDVLRDDGMIEHSDVVKLRAATNVPVGDPRDGFVLAVIGTRRSDGGIDIKEQGRIRLGTRFLVGEGKERKSFAVADLIEHGGGVVGDDELIRVDDGEPMPFLWEFGDTLPKPEDFVLACSSTTLEDIYKAAEWESHRPHMPPPMVMDGGPVQPLSHRARSAMARNEPLSFESATSNPTEL